MPRLRKPSGRRNRDVGKGPVSAQSSRQKTMGLHIRKGGFMSKGDQFVREYVERGHLVVMVTAGWNVDPGTATWARDLRKLYESRKHHNKEPKL